MSESEWENYEKLRNMQKNIEMALGNFHQALLGECDGWENLKKGHITKCDVLKADGTSILEVKNRSNTCNSDSGKSVNEKLIKQLENGVETVALVQVNCPGGKVDRSGIDPRIKVWSGEEAYAIVSGRETFFEDLKATFVDTFKMFKTYDELTAVTGIPIVEDPAIVSCREVEACRVGGVWNKEKLMKKTGGDLKVWCKQNKLKLTGKKEELVNRVLESGV